MMSEKRQKISTVLRYVVLTVVGFIMVYPLLWMVSATFKENSEIFSSLNLIPQKVTFTGYANAFKKIGGDLGLIGAMINTYKVVISKVIFTVVSCTIAAYGFGRFKFKGRNLMFSIMISTLFLPQVVLNIPQYVLFNQLGWIDSKFYLPLVIPSLFATDTYFVFMLIQFLRNVPKELEEAAKIDGANVFQTLLLVIVPMLKPALVSVALFQFMWSSNDFMGPLLYVKTPSHKVVAQYVKLAMDADNGFDWNRVLAVSLISIIPSLIVFFLAQNSFVEGISAGGVKG
ncbi:carbohydrate ABC transporter permease [Clostridiales bacterium COT073_COT-073]|nr:carbohydrate ABC transporter permease [Clostridiales bacterium COT073_COT-073]